MRHMSKGGLTESRYQDFDDPVLLQRMRESMAQVVAYYEKECQRAKIVRA